MMAPPVNQAQPNPTEPVPAPAPTPAPAFLRPLFPHQRSATQWMAECETRGKGGILADEMGLGKTTSAIAHIWNNYTRNPAERTLIIVPKAVVAQWCAEITACVGDSLQVLNFTGTRRFRKNEPLSPEAVAEYPIVVTTHNQT
jgi:Superfamily II DNA/RNA helicases, SNF2 family